MKRFTPLLLAWFCVSAVARAASPSPEEIVDEALRPIVTQYNDRSMFVERYNAWKSGKGKIADAIGHLEDRHRPVLEKLFDRLPRDSTEFVAVRRRLVLLGHKEAFELRILDLQDKDMGVVNGALVDIARSGRPEALAVLENVLRTDKRPGGRSQYAPALMATCMLNMLIPVGPSRLPGESV